MGSSRVPPWTSTIERGVAGSVCGFPQHYCRVYIANLGKLGYLSPEDAQLVASFYQYVESDVRDVTEGGIIYEGTNGPRSFYRGCKRPQIRVRRCTTPPARLPVQQSEYASVSS
ncbi:hypothetical protein EMIT0P253_260027 [Pseudomonas sp. IT-P253]